MKPLYTKKNGTYQRVAAIEVTMPASYPSTNVTYGAGNLNDVIAPNASRQHDNSSSESFTLNGSSVYLLIIASTTSALWGVFLLNTTGSAVYSFNIVNNGITISSSGLTVTTSHTSRTVRSSLMKLY